MFKIALKYGLLIVLFTFLWVAAEYLLGINTSYLNYHPLATLLSLVVPLIFLYLGMRETQRAYRGVGNFSYGKSFTVGVLIALIVAIVSPLGQWLMHELIFPGFLNSMQPGTEAQELSKGIDAEVNRLQAEESFSLSTYLLQSAIGLFVAGVVMSAILAIFVRDKALPKGG